MTVRANKPAFNIREKLKSLDYSHLPYEKMPPGSVIQHSFKTLITSLTYSGSGYIYTGLNVEIAPKFASSLLAIQVAPQYRLSGNYDHGVGFQINKSVAGGTETSILTPSTTYENYFYDGDSTSNFDYRGRAIMLVHDYPVTTETVNYKLYFAPYRTDYSNVLKFNDNGNRSFMHIWEIRQ
jgi:hypothetical protein